MDTLDDHANPGDMIDDRYELDEVIGRGGMGTVWRAWDRVLNADVALKLIAQDNSERSPRLLREARACAILQHPAIVRILAYGTTDAHAYIAMELLEGGTLDDVLQDGPIASDEAVRLVMPIIEALAVVHAAGVVHRDVKPDNILLSRQSDGSLQPKLVDFGIAKSANAGLPARLTMTGAVLGTPYFMSPEQAGGRADIDHTTDIWATCAVLYESITGVGAFDGENYNSVIRAVLLEDPQPMSCFCEIDEQLEQMIMRGLAKDRAARWASAGDLALELANWLRERGHRCDVTGRMLRGAPQWDAPSAKPTLVSAATARTERGDTEHATEVVALGGPLRPVRPPRDTEPPLPALASTVHDGFAMAWRARSRPVMRLGLLSAVLVLLLGSYRAGSHGAFAPAQAAQGWTHAIAIHLATPMPRDVADAGVAQAEPEANPRAQAAVAPTPSSAAKAAPRSLRPWHPRGAHAQLDNPPMPQKPSF
jgi:serine/threonine-protein kinase